MSNTRAWVVLGTAGFIIGVVTGCAGFIPITPSVFCTIDGDCTGTMPPCGQAVRCNTATNECEFESKCSSNQVCDNNQCCASVVNTSCGQCGTGKYDCSGNCIEGAICDPGWTRANLQGQPDPNGGYCVFRKSTAGGVIDLERALNPPDGLPTGGILFIESPAPAECETRECAARAVLGSLSNCITNDEGSASFRCDGDAATERSLLLTGLKETYLTPGDGPQFPCKTKLEILGDSPSSNCRLGIDEVVWTGGYLACP